MPHPLLSALKAPSLNEMEAALRAGENIAVTGLAEGQAAFVASKLASCGLKVLLVAANDLRAASAAADAGTLLSSGVASLPGGELDLVRGASSQESAWRRVEALSQLAQGQIQLLTVSMDALMQRMGPPEPFWQAMLKLHTGDRLSPASLLSSLIRAGYERVELVEGKGQCALRGAILDVFPPSAAAALRIEYFDDEIDSLRTFDCITQRSLDALDEVTLSPASEALLPAEEAAAAAQRMRQAIQTLTAEEESPLLKDLPPLPEDDDALPEFFDAEVAPRAKEAARRTALQTDLDRRVSALMGDAQSVEEGLPFRRSRVWLPVLTEHVYTVTDWYRPDAVLLLEPDSLRQRARERLTGFGQDLSSAIARKEAVSKQEQLLMDWPQVLECLNGLPLAAMSDLKKGLGGVQTQKVFSLEATSLSGYASQVRTLAEDVRIWLERGDTVALLTGGVSRGERLRASLSELSVPCLAPEDAKALSPGTVTLLPMTLSHGFVWPQARFALVSDTDIWGAGYRRSRSRRNSGEKIAAFTDLQVGDYVVHEDHGVGIYQGTAHIQNAGTWRDYLLIQYDGSDKLYVPIEQLQRVQRYIGNPNQPPKLNRIGGGDWQRQKGKVKEGLKKLAFDLKALYARRSQETGHAFPPDTPWQREFEDQFPWELTADQAQSVREITADMESARNMDRLLVGDVGYGKTEVSLRAAFKCVMDSRQVAMLAPTTILAQQHYNTIRQRFAGFPVRVEVLSRFRSAKEQKSILQDTADGKVDILVGTHRLLGKDVKFKNLGLLIVDEEQRFGVQHKEAIKNLKSTVDVLTLSATPIPRTLHMSMVGIRDMSVLETPPEDRLPVQTHVVEYSDALVRDAILRELSRGGQVYFLYNRVRSIEQFYQRLRQLVPEARIGVAHGQMRESALEDVMMDFYAGSFDVLLCTTIIESGLDVPTANTLIVYDSERFGLSQLYQLRGRVGRSATQAYAYFTVRQDKVLSETAEQRLSAIREFTEFGAGFRIAMRDLEIRGAGNILGPEQHGHLETVGYEMYCKLIEETLREVQGQKDYSALETRVDLQVDAFLPAEYIADEHQRMEMYKRIASIENESDRADILDELIDRFGEVPQSAQTLLEVSLLRAVCNRLGVSQVTLRPPRLLMKLDGRFVPDPLALVRALEATDSRLTLTQQGTATAIALTGRWKDAAAAMREAIRVMGKVSDKLSEKAENA